MHALMGMSPVVEHAAISHSTSNLNVSSLCRKGTESPYEPSEGGEGASDPGGSAGIDKHEMGCSGTSILQGVFYCKLTDSCVHL
jgi:hypothetical protein